MRLSREIVEGLERAAHRSLPYAAGLTENELVPGHIHPRELAASVKAGIRIAGGTPLEFNTIAIWRVARRDSMTEIQKVANKPERCVLAHC
jgi:dihydroxy-acid dehydratase